MQEAKITEEYVKVSDFELENKDNFESKLAKFLRSSYFTAICVVLVGVSSFILGRISKRYEVREPVRVFEKSAETKGEVMGASIDNSPLVPLLQQERETKQKTTNSGAVVASKNGTKYHYPWCPGANQIAEKNKIFFNSIEEARTKGYTPAANCKGLK